MPDLPCSRTENYLTGRDKTGCKDLLLNVIIVMFITLMFNVIIFQVFLKITFHVKIASPNQKIKNIVSFKSSLFVFFILSCFFIFLKLVSFYLDIDISFIWSMGFVCNNILASIIFGNRDAVTFCKMMANNWKERFEVEQEASKRKLTSDLKAGTISILMEPGCNMVRPFSLSVQA